LKYFASIDCALADENTNAIANNKRMCFFMKNVDDFKNKFFASMKNYLKLQVARSLNIKNK
jgi:hypothetical protein